jgi:nucleoside-diphosphate-sugar epimerase
MVNILITGGAGFIPSSLAEKLLEREDVNLVLVDNLITGYLSNVPTHNRCLFIRADVNNYNDLSAIMTAQKFDYVFHYAAVVGVSRTIENPALVLDDVKGFQNIFTLCKNTGVRRIFFSSSSEVYGEPVSLPQHEHNTPLNSRLPYAVVKNIGEAFCRSYQQEYGLNYTIFRFFNTYGPKQSTDFVMSKFLQAALNNSEITIYGDGTQTRTFCYIKDNIDACLAVLDNDDYINEVYNIGSDRVISILELAETIIRLTNSSSKIIHLPALKDGDMTRRQPDITAMRRFLNRELVTYEDGIRHVVNSWSSKKMLPSKCTA